MISKLTNRQRQAVIRRLTNTDAYFAQMLIDMANKTRLVDCTLDQIKQGFAKYEIVVALWQDVNVPFGYGFLILKGAKLIKEISTTDFDIDIDMANVTTTLTAVLCVDLEQAVKVRNFFGDRDYDA